jgi:hypothetical protein
MPLWQVVSHCCQDCALLRGLQSSNIAVQHPVRRHVQISSRKAENKVVSGASRLPILQEYYEVLSGRIRTGSIFRSSQGSSSQRGPVQRKDGASTLAIRTGGSVRGSTLSNSFVATAARGSRERLLRASMQSLLPLLRPSVGEPADIRIPLRPGFLVQRVGPQTTQHRPGTKYSTIMGRLDRQSCPVDVVVADAHEERQTA